MADGAWIFLSYVTIYAVDTVNGVPQPGSLQPAAGLLKDGNLEIFDREGSGEILNLQIPGFNISQQTLSGTFTIYSSNPPATFQGTMTLKAVNGHDSARRSDRRDAEHTAHFFSGSASPR